MRLFDSLWFDLATVWSDSPFRYLLLSHSFFVANFMRISYFFKLSDMFNEIDNCLQLFSTVKLLFWLSCRWLFLCLQWTWRRNPALRQTAFKNACRVHSVALWELLILHSRFYLFIFLCFIMMILITFIKLTSFNLIQTDKRWNRAWRKETFRSKRVATKWDNQSKWFSKRL